MYSYVALLCCKGTCQTVFSFILFFQEQGCWASCYTATFQNAYTPEDRPAYYNLHNYNNTTTNWLRSASDNNQRSKRHQMLLFQRCAFDRWSKHV